MFWPHDYKTMNFIYYKWVDGFSAVAMWMIQRALGDLHCHKALIIF